MNFTRQTACLAVNPVTVNNFVAFFNCTPAGRTLDVVKTLAWKPPIKLVVARCSVTGIQLLDFSCFSGSVLVFLLI